MKKRIHLGMVGALALLLAAALLSGRAEAAQTETTTQAAETEESAAGEEAAAVEPDIDWTKLSTTMLLAEASNLYSNPEAYLGKRIRTAGILQAIDYNGRTITSIYLGDASSCCGATIEFQREGEYRYPEDYPAPGSVVFVEGVYELYEEDETTYRCLNNAVMSTEKFWENR